ncbi:MAG: DUF4147 domain-containing protein [Myxococcota bacterium]
MVAPSVFASGPLQRSPDTQVAARVLEAALAAVDPGACVRRALRVEADAIESGRHRMALRDDARVWLIAVGKAAEAMTRAAVPPLGARLAEGLVVAKHPSDEVLDSRGRITTVVGAHPVPDERSLAAGQAVIDFVQRAGEQDLVVMLLSGGASSLMVAPLPGTSLEDIAARGDALLRSGAPIEQINAARTQLDRLKGGGLLRLAAPTRVLSLVLCDVVDAPLSVVGSGPTMPGPMVAIADNDAAVHAALAAARAEGWATERWPALRGEARVVGQQLAQRLRDAKVTTPTVFVAGGETTVTVHGRGRGGRNQELALAAVEPLDGHAHRTLITLATDGEDGPTDAAGAVVRGRTAADARARGFDVAARLDDNDAYPVFEGTGDLLRIGPTGTNVCDLVLGLARP